MQFMPSRPNILLITTDQHHPDFMGCAGHTQLKTPNLDRLAAVGVRFDNAWCATPLCTPARASILTGQMPSRHRGYTIGVDTPEDCLSVARCFSDGGYHTAILGKAHFLRCCTEGSFESPPKVFDEAFFRSWRGPFFGFDEAQLIIGHTTEPHSAGMHYRVWLRDQGVDVDRFFTPPGQNTDYSDIGRWDIDERYHPSAWLSETAIDYLDRRKADEQPFFAWVSFQDPHDPFKVPAPWCDMYDPATVELLPGSREGEFDNKPPFYKTLAEGRYADLPWHYKFGTPSAANCWPDEATRRRMTATYMGMVSLMDKHLGRILDRLDATGLAENTIVVFTTDHGDYLGHHGFRSKGLPAYDDVQRLPFIVRMPKAMQQAAGTASRSLVSQIDLAPTFLRWAGLPIPYAMQGMDMPGVLAGGEGPGRQEAIVELRPVRDGIYQKTLITPEHKLVVYDHLEWGELYDRAADPEQLDNLYHNPACAALRESLMRRLVRCEMNHDARRPRRTGYA